MSFLLCPLCGKQTSLNRFDPSGFDLDVYVQEVVGLGRARGFATTGRGSILGQNDTCEAINERILKLIKLFIEHGIVTRAEVAERFGLRTVDDLEAEQDRTQALKEEREEAVAAIRQLIDKIEEVLEAYGTYSFEGDDDLDGALSALGEAVDGLLDALSARREEASEAMEAVQVMITDIENNLDVGGEFAIDEEGGLANALSQLSNAIERLLDEIRAGGENNEDTN